MSLIKYFKGSFVVFSVVLQLCEIQKVIVNMETQK